jgi:hypothetical protein
LGGRHTIKYSRKEQYDAIKQLLKLVNQLSKKYLNLNFEWDFQGGYHNIDLYWSRNLNTEEMAECEIYKKKREATNKREEYNLARRLAKKHKLI